MSKVNNKGKFVILKLQQQGSIPKTGYFEITEDLIQTYVDCYDLLFSKTTGLKNKGMKNFARKIAGLSLLKELEQRGEEIKSNAGIVYMISNPSFPNHVKIGMTQNLNKRLATYQTYDPYRQFKVEHYEFVCNRKQNERKILNSVRVDIERGEWIKRPIATTVFHCILRDE